MIQYQATSENLTQGLRRAVCVSLPPHRNTPVMARFKLAPNPDIHFHFHRLRTIDKRHNVAETGTSSLEQHVRCYPRVFILLRPGMAALNRDRT